MADEKKERIKLNHLTPAAGATHKNRRRGRGTGAGQGRTCGKGHKGQKARAGYHERAGFEGGQMPIQRRLPKRGFNNFRFRKIYQIVNLKRLTEVFGSGGEVSLEMLQDKGLVKKSKIPVKLLGDGEVSAPFHVHVHAASQTATEKVKAAGGEVHLLC